MRRRKHPKDAPKGKRRCPCCGSRVMRVGPREWRCCGCPAEWWMDGRSRIHRTDIEAA